MLAHPDLLAQNEQFEKQIHKLENNIFSAVGYAASNVHFLVGADGVIVIDTTESTQAAKNILADFRQISKLPINTIIYTHSHRDHISGATVFAEGREVEIIASDNFTSDLIAVDKSRPAPNAILGERTKRQFGIGLPPEELISLGVGPSDRPMQGLGAGYIEPTVRFSTTKKIMREGFELEFAKAPGETPDHQIVWLASKRILFCGDNFYHSFPNLYAIRGTPYRDFDAWADTMDQLMTFDAEILAPGHTKPVIGAANVRQVLTDYRDAIRFVISETARGMNARLDPVTIAANLRLPDELAQKPYLKEFYGHIGYASRAYFEGTLGWFDGNPTSLGKLPPKVEAVKFIQLAGGKEEVLMAAIDAITENDPQWTMELTDRLLAAGDLLEEARQVKAIAMRMLAKQTVNAPTRNYYLLSARTLDEM